MSIERVKKLLKQKESIRLEFKESRTDLPGNLFESICSMLNREGGDILLGVADDGTVKGIDVARRDTMKANLVTLSNNPNKLDPPFILFPKVYEIKGQFIFNFRFRKVLNYTEALLLFMTGVTMVISKSHNLSKSRRSITESEHTIRKL